jgi:hypothetical protein
VSCPFHGLCALPAAQSTVEVGGNRCALAVGVVDAACIMPAAPDWARCERNTPGMQGRAAKILEWSRNERGREELAKLRYPG